METLDALVRSSLKPSFHRFVAAVGALPRLVAANKCATEVAPSHSSNVGLAYMIYASTNILVTLQTILVRLLQTLNRI